MLRLYRFRYSTNVERVALALAHKRLAVESVWVDPQDRSLVREVSGQDLVPVLEADGRVAYDSMRIVAWLEENYPDPPLYPAEPARRAETLVFVEWFDRVWKRPPNEIEAELGRREPDEGRIDALSSELAGWLDLFEALLTGRDYLLGEFSAADCAAFPFLKYSVLGLEPDDDELFHRILVEHQPLADRHRRLPAWVRRVDERPRA